MVSPVTATVDFEPTSRRISTRPSHWPLPSREGTTIRCRLPRAGQADSKRRVGDLDRPVVVGVAGPAVVRVLLGRQVGDGAGGGPAAARRPELGEGGVAAPPQDPAPGGGDRVVGGGVLGVGTAVDLARPGVAQVEDRGAGVGALVRRVGPCRDGLGADGGRRPQRGDLERHDAAEVLLERQRVDRDPRGGCVGGCEGSEPAAVGAVAGRRDQRDRVALRAERTEPVQRAPRPPPVGVEADPVLPPEAMRATRQRVASLSGSTNVSPDPRSRTASRLRVTTTRSSVVSAVSWTRIRPLAFPHFVPG